MTEDIALVQRICKGDAVAFEQLLNDYGGLVKHLVSRYTVHQQESEDLIQEIFIDIYKGVHGFKGQSSLKTWIYRVSLNHCLRHAERQKPANLEFNEAAAMVSSNSLSPHESLERGETKKKVTQALSHLSDIHRSVIVLHELNGLTFKECAEVLDVPVGTVKSRLSNAFGKLRPLLLPYKEECSK